ncbi:hypothetical protein RCO27_16685 [Sphingosinicella sp. LHD-64]|uniref:hypothetical protein n=1 Tax=Sphingosinicella sp. LHD-64 TaxID=3072139 RepID=UPI00280EEF69|nr:hypothetical protein [Sphingosinicella sp. LHD-64]MDQ8757865.1 hypothetical protein [Sphingosinicella sp. LHD-64]
MSTQPYDAALDALLANYTPPPMPEGLAARVAEAAVTLPQEASRSAARPWRDRRGSWLRRPLVIGGAAFGLAFSGAVAATYVGVPLPPKVQSVLAELPFVRVKAEPEAPKAPPRKALPARAEEMRPATAGDAQPRAERPLRAFWRELSPYERRRLYDAPPGRRLAVAKQIVDSRRSVGLPTPGAERIERAFDRRRARAVERDPVATARIENRRAIRRARIRAEIERRREIAPALPVEVPSDIASSDIDPGAARLPDNNFMPADPDRAERFRAFREERLERRRALREERLRRWRARQERRREGFVEPPR